MSILENCSVEYVYCHQPGKAHALNAGMDLVCTTYFININAIKRFQDSYCFTLVTQGAFCAYRTEIIRKIGGWQDVLGEDIVLTYKLLQHKLSSIYEPRAVGYTTVPPWKQGTTFS